MPQNLKKLFDEIRETWESTRDGSRIAQFYHAPVSALRGDGSYVTLETSNVIAIFFQNAIDAFFRNGYVRWDCDDFNCTLLGTRGAVVSLTWIASKADSADTKKIPQTYILVNFEDGWKIVHSIVHL